MTKSIQRCDWGQELDSEVGLYTVLGILVLVCWSLVTVAIPAHHLVQDINPIVKHLLDIFLEIYLLGF